MNNAFESLLLVGRILGFAIFLQSLEFLKIKDSFSEKGIWRWSEIRNDYLFLPLPVRRFLDWIMYDAVFNEIIKWRFFMGILAFIYPHFSIVFIFLFLSSFLITLRWRGSYNGGSDYMGLITLLCLCVAFLQKDSVLLSKAAIWYITLQVVCSYFLAGLYKVKQEKWRKGSAIYNFVSSPNYKVPEFVLKKSQDPRWSMKLSWAVILFELGFPLALFHPSLTKFFLFAGLIFHLANFCIFGLNRFFWVWCSTYPAVLYCAYHLQSLKN